MDYRNIEDHSEQLTQAEYEAKGENTKKLYEPIPETNGSDPRTHRGIGRSMKGIVIDDFTIVESVKVGSAPSQLLDALKSAKKKTMYNRLKEQYWITGKAGTVDVSFSSGDLNSNAEASGVDPETLWIVPSEGKPTLNKFAIKKPSGWGFDVQVAD